MNTATEDRLEYLRGQLRAERISYGELAELQGLADQIEPGDVELLEAAGVPEFEENAQTGTVQVSETDITLLETLSDAAVRAGQLPLAIQGYALTLRLRAETGLHPKRRKDDE